MEREFEVRSRAYLLNDEAGETTVVFFDDEKELLTTLGVTRFPDEFVGKVGRDRVFRYRRAADHGVEFLGSGRRVCGAMLVCGIENGRVVSAKTPPWELDGHLRPVVNPIKGYVRALRYFHLSLQNILVWPAKNGLFKGIPAKTLARDMLHQDETTRLTLYLYVNSVGSHIHTVYDFVEGLVQILAQVDQTSRGDRYRECI